MSVQGWQEWTAQDLVQQYRERYPDLTRDEEERIYDFATSTDGHCLFLRNYIENIGPVVLKMEACTFTHLAPLPEY